MTFLSGPSGQKLLISHCRVLFSLSRPSIHHPQIAAERPKLGGRKWGGGKRREAAAQQSHEYIKEIGLPPKERARRVMCREKGEIETKWR